ncbi:hypothetical protein GUK34_02070 [Rhizobium leguminosarum]|uniref:hypothetical protein n=1 Tax=Rhizobium ruizarguesonis TaxID=2081791 RepID=UPI0013BC70A7|nr:hypothetical protein [Rhizobium ruizarguesonis]NEI03677.1 hypothetical protein [Rhizobium ruizarguesonis]
MHSRRKVGPDIVALVHHIELNESGWVNTAIRKAVRFLFWMIGEPADITMIMNERGNLGLTKLTREQAETAINELLASNSVLPVGNDRFKLSESEMLNLEASITTAEDVENNVRKKVLKAAQAAGVAPGEDWERRIWDGFHEEFIVPFIREFGARAYELMTGANTNVRQNIFISDFLGKFTEDRKMVLEAMILAALDKNDGDCRKYILRLLNSYFFQSAVSLPRYVTEKAFAKPGQERRLRLVLDTNFLFSLFKLHSNPSNEAVSMLQDLIARVPRPFSVDMYVLPSTIDEFHRSITYYQGVAERIRPTSSVVSAGIKSNVSGVIEAFLLKARESKYQISAKEYFDPYFNDINAILSGYGVNVLNGQDKKYATDQSTIDDALDQKSFYANKNGNGKREKSYDRIWHDMVLWHVISDKRPQISDTIFDAEWVGVTIDFGFIAFDNHKRHGAGIPLLVHPATLVQALQIVIPSDENLEKTILALMQMPFLFEQFDIEDEKATQKILGTLSMYENIDELREETILTILGNKVLRAKMSEGQDPTGEIALIRDAIVDHLAEKTREADEAKAHLVRVQELMESERKRGISHLETVQEESSARLVAAVAEKERAEAARLSTDAELADTRAKLQKIESDERARTAAREIRTTKLQFAASIVFSAAIATLAILAVWHYSLQVTRYAGWLAPLAAQITIAVVSLMLCKIFVNSRLVLTSWWPAMVLNLIANWSWAAYAFLFLAFLEPRASDTFEKGLFPNVSASGEAETPANTKPTDGIVK